MLNSLSEKYLRIITITLSLLLIIVLVFLLKELEAIILPFFIAIIITFLFEPFYNWMRKKKLPTVVSIIVVLITILVISNIASVVVYTGINSFTASMPEYQQRFDNLYNSAISFLEIEPEDEEKLKESLQLKNLLADASFTSIITNIFTSVLNLFSNFILILLYVAFMLSEISSMKARMKKAFSADNSKRFTKSLSDIFSEVRRYLVGKTVLALIQAIVLGIIMWLFGVDFFLIWAFLFFITDYIPNIGSFIATIFTAISVFLQYDNLVTPIVLITILVLIQNLKGNVVEPKVLGDKLDLSPILILLSLLFWGYIWGIPGMVLSVPIMSMLKIVLMNFEQTKSIGILMSYNLTSFKTENDN